jgi:hypothetical protein
MLSVRPRSMGFQARACYPAGDFPRSRVGLPDGAPLAPGHQSSIGSRSFFTAASDLLHAKPCIRPAHMSGTVSVERRFPGYNGRIVPTACLAWHCQQVANALTNAEKGFSCGVAAPRSEGARLISFRHQTDHVDRGRASPGGARNDDRNQSCSSFALKTRRASGYGPTSQLVR